MSETDIHAYLIKLLRSLLEGAEPPAMPADCSPLALMELAERHSVAGMAYYAVEKLPPIDLETAVKWRQIRDKALVRDLTQLMDLEVIGRAFSDAGIRFLPLKGSIIKGMYPQSDMRTMSDIDILIDPENAEKVREIMTELGYSCEHFGYDVHDVYHKPPVMSVEVHRALFGEDGKEFQPVFADPWVNCTADGMRYSFTPDAFFAYILAHAVKHLEEGGIGIRSVMDLHVCLKSEMGISLRRSLDILAPSGKRETAALMAELSEVWFGDRPHSEATRELEKYIFGSGTYGTVENAAANRIARAGKLGYLMRLIFPPFERMKEHYPVLRKAPVLLPGCWLVRLVTKPFINRRQNAEKLKTLMKK